jgi:nicotinamide-nucleotide amidase
MKAVIITIGDEILLGQILDTNSRFIARQLTNMGAETVEMRSVADERNAIVRAVNDAFLRADAIIITGGLGPTKDDITKKVLAEYFDTPLVYNEQAGKWLEEVFATHPEHINAYNKSQAVLPAACVPLHNAKGTASGMWFEKKNKVLISLPGVPFETEYLMREEVLPRLKEKYTDWLLRYKVVTVYEVIESELAERLARFEETLPENTGLAYLPSPEYVRLRLTAKGAQAAEGLKDVFDKLLGELSGLKFEVDRGETPSEEMARRFRAAGVTIACAESCTGGNIAHIITSIAGSSAYFLGGIVSYSNEVKKQVLGVSAQDLEKFGAVSETVALQMAQGARKVTGADYAVSTTGIAGPEGGSEEKPVGTIWIAVAGPNTLKAKKVVISHTRERNIGRGSFYALQMLLDTLEQDKKVDTSL